MMSEDLKNKRYFEAFEAYERDGFSSHPTWLKLLQKEALSQFAKVGFPTTRDEAWKYTNVEPSLRASFDFNPPSKDESFDIVALEDIILGDLEWDRLVFVNGFWSEKLSSLSSFNTEIKIESLHRSISTHPEILERYLGRFARCDNGFTALNTAFIRDGAFVSIPDGVTLKDPIHLIFITDRIAEGHPISQPRNLVYMGKGSQGTVIESYVSLSQEHYFTNALTEVVLDEGARLNYYKIQQEGDGALHVGTTEVSLNSSSTLNSYVISVGALLGRSNLYCALKGEKTRCNLNGLYLTSGKQLLDHHTEIDHMKPQGMSKQLYKGLLSGNSKAVFNGKIYVRPSAQGTDAHQINKNLILSEEAQVNTRPQLEILANDVQCTHGAAVGQLDEEEVFYLKSRGIPDEIARSLLMQGFAREVIDRIEIPSIQEGIDRLLFTKLNLSRLNLPEGLEGSL